VANTTQVVPSFPSGHIHKSTHRQFVRGLEEAEEEVVVDGDVAAVAVAAASGKNKDQGRIMRHVAVAIFEIQPRRRK